VFHTRFPKERVPNQEAAGLTIFLEKLEWSKVKRFVEPTVQRSLY
jgi:hypothetical protein